MASCFDFSSLDVVPPVEVFHLIQEFAQDEDPRKVNLSVGAYRTDEAKPWVLPVVRTAESQMASDTTLNHEYLSISGHQAYSRAAVEVLLGTDSPSLLAQRVVSFQAPGGTGAIRLGLQFLHEHLGANTVIVSKPTWENHVGIAKACGFENIVQYNYWDAANRTLDFDSMIGTLEKAPAGAVVLLHAIAHNPTGCDPSPEQWQRIADVMVERKLFPFFDIAYQGFASGDLDRDAMAVRLFDRLNDGFGGMFVAQSFSKNFGLYNERVGNIVAILPTADDVARVKSNMEIIIRRIYSNPPAHGARIVATVLGNKALYAEWRQNLSTMASRIQLMRQKLYDKLKALGTPGSWEHILQQRGMFSYTGLNPAQVDHLKTKYHIYAMKSGRVNMCGLTSSNLSVVAEAIHDAVCNVK